MHRWLADIKDALEGVGRQVELGGAREETDDLVLKVDLGRCSGRARWSSDGRSKKNNNQNPLGNRIMYSKRIPKLGSWLSYGSLKARGAQTPISPPSYSPTLLG